MGDIEGGRGAAPVPQALIVAGFLGTGKTRIVRALTGNADDAGAGGAPFRDRPAGECTTEGGAVLSVVEASPFAVPGSTAGQVIVTAVDAVNAVANLADADFGDLVARQVRAADVVVLTCGDVADTAPVQKAIAALTGAPVIEAHAEADLARAVLAAVIRGGARPDPGRAPEDHRRAFTVWTYSGTAVLTGDTLKAFLAGRPAGAYRICGAVRLPESGARVDVFGRGRRTTPAECPDDTTLTAAGPARRLLAREMDMAFAEAVAAAAYGRGAIACR